MTDTQEQPEAAPSGLPPDAEAAVDAALAQMWGEDADTESGGSAEATQEPATAPTGEDSDGLGVEGESEPEGEGTSEGEGPDLTKAHERLRLAGVPTSAFEGLAPEETLAWVSRLAARESEVNRAFRERADLEKRLSEAEATKEAEPGVPTATLDLDAEKAALADQFGDSEADALIGLAQKIANRGAPEVESLKTQLQASAAVTEALLTERVRGELGARDPRLLDAENFQRVQTRAALLHKVSEGDPRYAGLDFVGRYSKLMEDAALLELGSAPQEENGSPTEEAPPRRTGTPTRPSRASQSRPRSKDEILDAKIAAIQKGATAAEVRAKFGG